MSGFVMSSLFVGFVKVFLFVLLPMGILCGLCGSLVRYFVEGNEHEDFYVCGSMLLFAFVSVFIFGLNNA